MGLRRLADRAAVQPAAPVRGLPRLSCSTKTIARGRSIRRRSRTRSWVGCVLSSRGSRSCAESRPSSFSGSAKESVGKTRMSFSLFNQDTDLKKSPSPFPLPLEREFFSPSLPGHTPPLPERSAFFSLSRGRGKGEGPFSRHGGGTEQRSETGPRKTHGLQTVKMLQVALYHALGNLPESEFTHESF